MAEVEAVRVAEVPRQHPEDQTLDVKDLIESDSSTAGSTSSRRPPSWRTCSLSCSLGKLEVTVPRRKNGGGTRLTRTMMLVSPKAERAAYGRAAFMSAGHSPRPVAHLRGSSGHAGRLSATNVTHVALPDESEQASRLC